MKKILLMAVSLGALCASAESYLYWMVGDTGSYKNKYDTTKIRVLENGEATDTYLSLYYADGTSAGKGISATYAEAAYAAELGMYAAIGAYSDNVYSFLIELRNDNGALFVAQSGSFTYSDVANKILDSGIGVPSDTSGSAWAPTGTYSIPEPTSGMMLLLGVAALALRRRRA